MYSRFARAGNLPGGQGSWPDDPLFKERLLPDIQRQEGPRVFPGIRDDRIDFYYSGGKLFSCRGKGYCTNLKHAMCFANARNLKTEIGEHVLATLKPIENFHEGYESIKALCKVYAREEAVCTARLYSNFSYAAPANAHERIVVLDIEVAFDSRANEDSEAGQDRVDALLFDTGKKRLLFVEVKLHSNPALRTSKGEPEVAGQIRRYEEQIQRQESDILVAYGAYVREAKRCFHVDLPNPEYVVPRVALMITGYDSAQKRHVDQEVDCLKQSHVRCVSCGNLSNAKPATLISWFDVAEDLDAQ